MDAKREKDAKALLKKIRPVAAKLKFKKGLAKIDEMLKN
jgi:hypothetical protein